MSSTYCDYICSEFAIIFLNSNIAFYSFELYFTLVNANNGNAIGSAASCVSLVK